MWREIGGLVGDVMDVTSVTRSQLQRLTGMSARTLKRVIDGDRPLDVVELEALGMFLGITPTIIPIISMFSAETLPRLLDDAVASTSADLDFNDLDLILMRSILENVGWDDSNLTDEPNAARRYVLRQLVDVDSLDIERAAEVAERHRSLTP